MFLKERQEHQRPYDAAVCVVAAKLVRIAFAMVRDGSHFDLAKASSQRLVIQSPGKQPISPQRIG